MKNLNKKIGAMALAAMVMAGGVGLSSLSVSHAYNAYYSDIFVMASYNSNSRKDNEIFIREFGGWFDHLSGQKIDIVDLREKFDDKVFENRDELEIFMKKEKLPRGVYLASIKPDPKREKENKNILFKYKWD